MTPGATMLFEAPLDGAVAGGEVPEGEDDGAIVGV